MPSDQDRPDELLGTDGEPTSEPVSEMLASYHAHTERLNVLLHRWIEAVQVAREDADIAVLDTLRHQVKLSLDDPSHDRMLRLFSNAVSEQIVSDSPKRP